MTGMHRSVRAVERPSPQQMTRSIESRFILSLDPGTTTGWALFSKPNSRNGYRSGQIENGALGIWTSLETGAIAFENWPPDTVVCESFQYRPKLDKAVLEPVEVIGAVKVWCSIND